ncbi:MAG TPA: DUF4167 domain-containing protein [Allosphingosinicella sp.]|nr:DUF4167 domain-containing protein [Allosphingosinicella sp.]
MINNRQGGGRRRGRGGGGGGGPQRSNNPGPGNRQDNRQRGNAAQLLEKYKGLARDAQMQGDRVLTETYLQYADHYFRVLNENRARFEEQRRQRDDYEDEGDGEDYEGDETDVREDHRRDEPRYDEPRQPRREPVARREEREERPERGNEDRPERSEGRAERGAETRGERNGEYRAQRRPRTRRAEAEAGEDEGQSERISLDVLPPAISAANEDSVVEEAKPARPRRTRRPRATEEDIAPAA